MIIGHLDQLNGKQISGWLGSFGEGVLPFITANNKPCLVTSSHSPRPDVAQVTGLDEQSGFIAELPHLPFGEIEIALYAIVASGRKKLVSKKSFVGASISARRFVSVFEALEISKQENAVAIACWEGTHNPIGRAQALYNVVATQRPAVVIAFDMGFSDQGLWQPLISADINVLMIPWAERDTYFALFNKIGLSFNTVWICKPCYPSYELARHIASERTCFIQDIDDNEYAFSEADDAKKTPYGELSYQMAQQFFKQIPQRSVASVSLQGEFGGELVRHARTAQLAVRERIRSLDQEIRVGFIGTVRPHKGVIEAAKIINYINRNHGYRLRLVVGGEYEPPHLAEELKELGCEVHRGIGQSELNTYIGNLDVVITGFPAANSNPDITRYQISSKIGDALSNSRPVLVPLTDAVADLHNVPGIFLFNDESFVSQLLAAISTTDALTLPEQFTLEDSYAVFTRLEADARDAGPKFQTLFGAHHSPVSSGYKIPGGHKKKVVLVWKQHDAGLYGRRVDQIARSLACNMAIEEVIVLEVLTPQQRHTYAEGASRIDSDKQFIDADLHKKMNGYKRQGITYKCLLVEDSNNFQTSINRFLIDKALYPDDTLFVLFPAITEYLPLLACIDGYRTICDVVDNQISWSAKDPLPLLQQYATIAQAASKVIFNSSTNRQFFIEAGLCDAEKSVLIPNWYALPSHIKVKPPAESKNRFDILYSGNMNDRIDWELLKNLHNATNDHTRIHLIGNAERITDLMTSLIGKFPRCIYHGPMREDDLLAFASQCDLAIMPHTLDEFSRFMNPMKPGMYNALGLQCISTDIPGVDSSHGGVRVCKTSEEFIQSVLSFQAESAREAVAENPSVRNLPAAYFHEVMSLFN